MRSLIQSICIAALMVTAPVASALAGAELGRTVNDGLAVPEAGDLTVKEVAAMLKRKEPVFLFDANSHDSYQKGHIPGAKWIQYDAVTAAKLPKSKDAKLIFYCYNPLCGASPLAAKQALSLGYRNVWLLPEGITGWRKANLKVVSGTSAN